MMVLLIITALLEINRTKVTSGPVCLGLPVLALQVLGPGKPTESQANQDGWLP